jgi:hypothetical protein
MIKFLSVPALMALLLQLRWVHQVSHRAAASLTLITSGAGTTSFTFITSGIDTTSPSSSPLLAAVSTVASGGC